MISQFSVSLRLVSNLQREKGETVLRETLLRTSRVFIELFNRCVSWIERKQVIKPKDTIVKVNLGSSLLVTKGWINVDIGLHALISRCPDYVLKALYRLAGSNRIYSQEQYIGILKNHIFVHHNLEYGIPFPIESVDYIYTSHLLEHFRKDDAERFLKEAFRVLRINGRIRISVPDLEHAISLYLQGKKENALDYFYTNPKSGHVGDHEYMYDFEMLKSLLLEVGFSVVERCSYQKGKTPDIDKLDNRPEESLFVEAIKSRVPTGLDNDTFTDD